jgi:CheY-like chemotaxis protein
MAQPREVLVVEDEPLIADMLAGVLTDEGYQVTCTNSAQAALACIASAEHDFQALVTDINLECEIDGFGVAELLRQQAPHAATVFMTGDSIRRFRKQARRGAVILEKPFRPSEIVDALSAQLH